MATPAPHSGLSCSGKTTYATAVRADANAVLLPSIGGWSQPLADTRSPRCPSVGGMSGTDVVPRSNSVRHYSFGFANEHRASGVGGRRDAEHADAVRSRKARAAIRRGDFGACDPRRS